MPNLNRVELMGNCTRDPQCSFTPKGTAVTELGVAINHKYTTQDGEKREEVTFLDVTFWGRLAEIAGEYLKKGKPVYIEGRLKLDQWDDKETGKKRQKLRIIGMGLQLLGSRDGGAPRQHGEEEEMEQKAQPHSQRPAPAQSAPAPEPEGFEDDDIPFN